MTDSIMFPMGVDTSSLKTFIDDIFTRRTLHTHTDEYIEKLYDVSERDTESIRNMMVRYPDRCPIFIRKNPDARDDIPDIDKHKFLVGYDLTVSQLIMIIRKRINLVSSQGIYIFVNNELVPSSMQISELYKLHCHSAKYPAIFITYQCEDTFG